MIASGREARREWDGGGLPHVSVVIPTRDRPEALHRCLDSIAALAGPRPEVIVVDQSGAGASSTPAREGVSVYVWQEKVGKCRALNDGVQLASGDVVAFTDDDCCVAPDWLSTGLAWLDSHPDVGIVSGPALAMEHNARTVYVPQFFESRIARRRGRFATRHIGALGGNMMVRRSVFESVGLFDELLGPGTRFHSGEDQDFSNRALRAGYSLLYDPALAVTHWGGRRYDDGSAALLLRGYSVGIGALAAKSLRGGDIAATYPLLREVGAEARSFAWWCLGKPGSPRFVLRSPWLMAGLARGMLQPLDHQAMLFVAKPAGRH